MIEIKLPISPGRILLKFLGDRLTDHIEDILQR